MLSWCSHFSRKSLTLFIHRDISSNTRRLRPGLSEAVPFFFFVVKGGREAGAWSGGNLLAPRSAPSKAAGRCSWWICARRMWWLPTPADCNKCKSNEGRRRRKIDLVNLRLTCKQTSPTASGRCVFQTASSVCLFVSGGAASVVANF